MEATIMPSPRKTLDEKNKELCISKKFLRKLRRYFFKKLGIKIRHNSKHKREALLQALVFLGCRNVAAEEGVVLLKIVLPDELVPSADRILLRLKQLSLEQLQNVFMKALNNTIKEAKHLLTKPVMVAVDFQDIPFFGDINNIFVVGTKRKLGTNYAFRFATIEVVEEGKRFCLGCIPLRFDDEKPEVLKMLVRKAKSAAKIRLVLADRGFFDIKCINTLKEEKVKYIMPVIKDKKIKSVMKEKRFAVPTAIVHTMGEGKKEQATFTMCMKWMKKKDDEKAKIVGFATNIPIDFDNKDEMKEKIEWVSETYRSRWGIETGYRVKKDFRAKTTSTSAVIRHFYFFLSVLLFNLWTLFNTLTEKHFTTETTKFAIETLAIKALKKSPT